MCFADSLHDASQTPTRIHSSWARGAAKDQIIVEMKEIENHYGSFLMKKNQLHLRGQPHDKLGGPLPTFSCFAIFVE